MDSNSEKSSITPVMQPKTIIANDGANIHSILNPPEITITTNPRTITMSDTQPVIQRNRLPDNAPMVTTIARTNQMIDFVSGTL